MREQSILKLAAILAIAVFFASASISGQSKPTPKGMSVPLISVESSNFRVGDEASFSGKGFAPGEHVSIRIEVSQKASGLASEIDFIDAFADKSGQIEFSWRVPSAASYRVLATGSSSGLNAEKRFSANDTDGAYGGGSTSCTDINSKDFAFPHVSTDAAFLVDVSRNKGTIAILQDETRGTSLSGGAQDDPEGKISLFRSEKGNEFSWDSNREFTAVIAKGEKGAAVVYSPEFATDKGPIVLPSGEKIEQVEFCLKPETYGTIVIVKKATPPSSFEFGFEWLRHDNGYIYNFNMVDDDPVSDPSRTFNDLREATRTITLTNGGFYTLRTIYCTVAGRKRSTFSIDLVNGSATIDLKWGDTVTCTWECDLLTAADVSAAGIVKDPYGRPLAGAIVSVTDSSGRVRSVRTNNFGLFRFEGMEGGGAYLFEASHKLYSFGSQFRTMNGDLEGLVLTALPD